MRETAKNPSEQLPLCTDKKSTCSSEMENIPEHTVTMQNLQTNSSIVEKFFKMQLYLQSRSNF